MAQSLGIHLAGHLQLLGHLVASNRRCRLAAHLAIDHTVIVTQLLKLALNAQHHSVGESNGKPNRLPDKEKYGRAASWSGFSRSLVAAQAGGTCRRVFGDSALSEE